MTGLASARPDHEVEPPPPSARRALLPSRTLSSDGRDVGDDAGSTRTPTPQPARELGDFLLALAEAIDKHATLPAGHHALDDAIDGLLHRMAPLLVPRPAISIAARRQFVVNGVAVDSLHPSLSQLAERLHQQRIGALNFERGLSHDELGDVLLTIATEPTGDELPLGHRPALLELRWTHVRIFPLRYDRLTILEDDDNPWEEPRYLTAEADEREFSPPPPQIASDPLAPEPLRVLLAAPRHDPRLAERLVRRSGLASAEPLLDALAETWEPERRERLLALLATLGPAAAPIVALRLAAADPSLARELLTLIIRLAPPEAPPGAEPLLHHEDPLVRREAARLLVACGVNRDAALLAAVRDTDLRVVSVGLLGAQERCTAPAAASLRMRMDRGDIADDFLRAAGVRAVSATDEEGRAADDTLEWMLRRVLHPGRVLRAPRLMPVTGEMLAALGALAARWDEDPRALPALQLARAHESDAVRRAAWSSRRVRVQDSAGGTSPS